MTGHQRLISDLEVLLHDARQYEFHDFKCTKATPKIELAQRLHALYTNNTSGDYDNNPKDVD